ncbi:MAG: HDOD domain-containing protein [Granulosicoccaceae bacterium]
MQQDVFVDELIMRRLAPLNELNDANFAQVVASTRSYSLPPGAKLESRLEGGWYVYVVSGTVLLKNTKGERYGAVEAKSAAAAVPLFAGELDEGDAEAKTHVEFLRVDRLLYEVLHSRQADAGTEVLEIDFDEDDAAIFSSIYDAFEAKCLKVPSLPEVLMQVNKAIDDPDMGFAEIAQIIQKDPPYTARLIVLANSPAYGGTGNVNTLSFAISRIGVESTRNLLMGVAVERMMGEVHPNAVGLLREFYRQASEIAAICFVLARRLGSVPEERALMAGLLHRLGKVPIVSHAFDVLEPQPDPDRISGAADRLIPPVTSWMLSEWGMDAELCDVADSASDWYYACGEHLGLLDIVIAAGLLHAVQEGKQAPAPIEMTPIGKRLMELGLDVSDPEAFFAEIAEDLEAARQLV